MGVQAVTDKDFESEVLKSQTPVVVDFWAEWCGPCRALAPTLAEVAEEKAGKIKIVKVNVDENPEAPGKYGVRSIPALFLFKNGEVVSQSGGNMPKADLVSWIDGAV